MRNRARISTHPKPNNQLLINCLHRLPGSSSCHTIRPQRRHHDNWTGQHAPHRARVGDADMQMRAPILPIPAMPRKWKSWSNHRNSNCSGETTVWSFKPRSVVPTHTMVRGVKRGKVNEQMRALTACCHEQIMIPWLPGPTGIISWVVAHRKGERSTTP